VRSCGFVVPVEDRLLEPAIEAAEVDIEKHWDAGDLAGTAEFEKVVLEELIALHGCATERSFVGASRLLRMTGVWIPAFAGMTRVAEMTRAYFHHTFTTFLWVLVVFKADDN